MANGTRTGDPRGFNKGHSSKFRGGSRVWQTPKGVRRTYLPKHCGNNNKNDNSPKTLNDNNQQASSQKFRQLMDCYFVNWFLTKTYRHLEGWIYVSFSKDILFALNIVIFASRVLFSVCFGRIFFLTFLIEWSHSFTHRPATPTTDWFVVWILK